MVKPEHKNQAIYVERQKERGFVRLSSWVPKEDLFKAKRYCARLRKAAKQ